ncbi:hypothetical protein EBR96_05745, partial [bacterium]|nr:hypothetical protein [bacterium]
MDSDLIIHIEEGPFNQPRLSITKNGSKLSAFSTALPSALRQLLRQSGSYQSAEDELVRALHRLDVPVRISVGGAHRITASWDPEFTVNLKWRFDLVGDRIEISRIGFDDKGLSCPVSIIGHRLVVDLNRHVIGTVRSDGPGETESLFKRRTVSTERTSSSGSSVTESVGREAFNRFPIVVRSESGLESQTVFTVNGTETVLSVSPAQYIVNFSPHPTQPNQLIIQPGLTFGSEIIPLSADWNTRFENLLDIPSPISSTGWTRFVYDILSKAADAPALPTINELKAMASAEPPSQ